MLREKKVFIYFIFLLNFWAIWNTIREKCYVFALHWTRIFHSFFSSSITFIGYNCWLLTKHLLYVVSDVYSLYTMEEMWCVDLTHDECHVDAISFVLKLKSKNDDQNQFKWTKITTAKQWNQAFFICANRLYTNFMTLTVHTFKCHMAISTYKICVSHPYPPTWWIK